MSLAVDQPFNVYRDQLTALCHGLPLWNPDPLKKVYDKVSIGDVGYLREGTFIHMFNAMLPWDHPSNKTLVIPEPYKYLDCGPFTNILEDDFDKVEHYSHSVSSSETDPYRQALSPDE